MAAKKLLYAERKAAAKRAKDLGMVLGAAASGFPGDVPLPGIQGPGGVPHYFGPYGNWAFSPLPKGPVTAVTVTSGGTGYTNSPTVTIIDAHGTNDNVTVTANVIDGVIDSVDITNPQPAGSNLSFTAPIVIITDSTGTGSDWWSFTKKCTATFRRPGSGGMCSWRHRRTPLQQAQANTLRLRISTASRSIIPEPTIRSLPSITRITWVRSSLQREEYMAYRHRERIRANNNVGGSSAWKNALQFPIRTGP